jgi:molybdopterin-containing oxidoreductase family iron-sulfur binding subunit
MSCDVACKRENFTPPGVHWSKVHIYETGAYPHSKLRSLPTLCMHCDEPACRKACPTGATSERADGVVTIDNDRCIGCGYCALACPYEARALNRAEPRAYHAPHDFTPVEKIGYFRKLGAVEHGKGVIEKCTFCLHRLVQEGEPACVETCPSGARVFGDLDDPDSEVAKLVASRGAKCRLEDQQTKPKVLYIGLEEHLGH